MVTVSGAPQELIAFQSPGWLEVVRADGTIRTALIHQAAGPAWSPGGARLAYERSWAGSSLNIYSALADGSDTVNLSQHFSTNTEPAWSPDGSRIAFWSNRVLGGGIFVMNADGSNVQQLVGAEAIGWDVYSPSHPTWSPDGARLAFGRACNIHVINADGTGRQAVTDTTGGLGCNYSPAWSPDGQQLAFVSTMNYGAPNVWVMNVDGSSANPVSRAVTATMPSDGSPPSWSPQGTQIVFAAAGLVDCYDDYYYYTYQCPGPSHLWVVTRDGAAIRQITNGNGESRPSWRRAMPLAGDPQASARRR